MLHLCCGCCPHSLVLKYEEFEEQNRYNHFQLFRDEHNLAIRILTQLRYNWFYLDCNYFLLHGSMETFCATTWHLYWSKREKMIILKELWKLKRYFSVQFFVILKKIFLFNSNEFDKYEVWIQLFNCVA